LRSPSAGARDGVLSKQERCEKRLPTRTGSKRRASSDHGAGAVYRGARSRAGADLNALLAYREDRLIGSAVIDVRNVRTLPKLLVSPRTARCVRCASSPRAHQYQPSRDSRESRADSSDRISLGRIHSIAGATLSSHAVTRSVRTALALYQVLLEANQAVGRRN
jgi:hypothetical protein